MSGEFKHADPGNDLTHAEFIANGAHVADGQTAEDILYFDGTNWIRKPANTITTSSLFSTQTDVTASRALDAVYKNLNAFPIMVNIAISTGVSVSTTLMGNSEAMALCDASNPPGVQVADADTTVEVDEATSASDNISYETTLIFIVPTNYYYKIFTQKSGGGTDPAFNSWIEYGGTGTVV